MLTLKHAKEQYSANPVGRSLHLGTRGARPITAKTVLAPQDSNPQCRAAPRITASVHRDDVDIDISQRAGRWRAIPADLPGTGHGHLHARWLGSAAWRRATSHGQSDRGPGSLDAAADKNRQPLPGPADPLTAPRPMPCTPASGPARMGPAHKIRGVLHGQQTFVSRVRGSGYRGRFGDGLRVSRASREESSAGNPALDGEVRGRQGSRRHAAQGVRRRFPRD